MKIYLLFKGPRRGSFSIEPDILDPITDVDGIGIIHKIDRLCFHVHMITINIPFKSHLGQEG